MSNELSTLNILSRLTAIFRRLIVQDGAVVTASTFGGSQGRGGSLTVNASDSVELSGTTPNGEFPSGLLVGTVGGAAAGALTNGARITSRSEGQANAGSIELQAGSLSLDEGAFISAESRSPNSPKRHHCQFGVWLKRCGGNQYSGC